MKTTDILAIFAVILSFAALFFSWYSFYKTDELSKNAFNRNYRPYIEAINFSAENKDSLMVPDMNVIKIQVSNAPGLVTSKKLSFYIRDNEADSLLCEDPIRKDELFYPSDKNQYTMIVGDEIISHEIAKKLLPKILIRKIRIEYEWISDSSLKYYFESEWKYNIKQQGWDIIYQKAN